MAADLGSLSLTKLQQLAHQQNPNPTSWNMWNSRRAPDEDDSWEVRAFAEDTGNVMGSTWPPRSYTCTFCRREFRSAQALGGHMNVHRRDRARLHQSSSGNEHSPSSISSPQPPLNFPAQEFVPSGALCLLYPFPTPNPVFTQSTMTSSLDSPSTLLSISPYEANRLTPSCSPSINFPLATGIDTNTTTALSRSVMKVESTRLAGNRNIGDHNDNDNDSGFEELDLELRLGQRPSPH